jgi:Porin subfamily
MKMKSLLLSSAAVLVAGSAFAADLPAKKAAPAAAQKTGCPAFGAGYFSIPGTETCIKIGGYIRADEQAKNDTSVTRPAKTQYSIGYKYILGVDTAMNSEFGTVNARIGMVDGTTQQNITATAGSPTTESAWIKFAGLTAGFAPSNVDFNNAYNNTGFAYQPTGVSQLAYTADMGASKLTLAMEATTWTDFNVKSDGTTLATTAGTYAVASRPDLMAVLSSSLGAFSTKIGLVSHEVAGASGGTYQGYAALGRADYAAGPFKAIVNAGYASGAIAYIDNPDTYGYKVAAGWINDSDNNAQNVATGQFQQLSLEYAVDTKNTVYGYVGNELISRSTDDYKKSVLGGGLKMMLATNLYVRPEFYHKLVQGVSGGTVEADTTADVFYFRIRRDF